MLISLALNHSIFLDNKGNLHSASSDEITFAKFCKFVGYEFKGTSPSDPSRLVVNIGGSDVTAQILDTIDFTAERKKMTVIYKLDTTNKIYVSCKGADSEMMKRIAIDEDPEIVKETNKDVEHFSIHGLRTLVFGIKEYSTTEYE